MEDILKFEYLTQLLLDSNYLPLVLKLFAHQEIDKVVDSRTDRDDMRFVFSFPASTQYLQRIASSPSAMSTARTPPPNPTSPTSNQKKKVKTKQPPRLSRHAENYLSLTPKINCQH
jgi:hypothetical protein